MRTFLLAALFLALTVQPVAKEPSPGGSRVYCDPIVIRQFTRAWQATANGTMHEGTQEAGFRIDWVPATKDVPAHLEVGPIVMGQTPLRCMILTDENTIAIAHVHPNAGVSTPSKIDMYGAWADYVIGTGGLYVTIPGHHAYRYLRKGMTWTQPCDPNFHDGH